MSFLLDTNICVAHLKRPSGLAHRFMQHSGRLFLSTIVLGELYTWAHRRLNPAQLVRAIHEDLLADVQLLVFDQACALEFGRVRAELLARGLPAPAVDLQIASVALVHNITLVTNNTRDFQAIPGLALEDWLTP